MINPYPYLLIFPNNDPSLSNITSLPCSGWLNDTNWLNVLSIKVILLKYAGAYPIISGLSGSHFLHVLINTLLLKLIILIFSNLKPSF